MAGLAISPRFTALDHRVEYETFDVIDHLVRGGNRLGLQLAEGRFRGKVGGGGLRGAYGNQLATIAVLEIALADGQSLHISTGEEWDGGYGPVLTADPQDGAQIDTRVPGADFTSAESIWSPAATPSPVAVALAVVPATSEPVKVVSTLSADSIRTVDDRVVVDFGQNISGVASVTVHGRPGQEIEIHHSELLHPSGRIDRDYLNAAGMTFTQAIDRYVLNGSLQTIVPPMTMRGFQCIEIEGLQAGQFIEASGLAIAADLDYHGRFESSLPDLDRLHENIVWSMRGNFTDLPTDCPTRERSGWTGDAQVFAPAAAYLADVHAYYGDWLRDVALQQDPDGAVRDIVPREVETNSDHPMANLVPLRGSAGWADSMTLIPWTLFQHYGRLDVAEELWDSMVAWVEFTRRRASENRQQDRTGNPLPHEKFLVDTGFNWGEHLAADDPLEFESADEMIAMMIARNTHPDAEVATAYFARSAFVLGHMAAALGKDEDAATYLELWERVREAYQIEFLGDDGLPDDARQAPWVRPLAFDLIPEQDRQAAADRLAEIVIRRGNRVGTGFLSTGFLLGVLSRFGHVDTALDVLLQHDSPSWLAEVDQGATTIWEAYTGEGSRNHYSLGAIARWFYEDLAGIRPSAPGWTEVLITPLLSPRVTRVAASTMTPFGEVACEYQLSDGRWDVTVTVPPGTSASLVLSEEEAITLPSGRTSWRVPTRVDAHV